MFYDYVHGLSMKTIKRLSHQCTLLFQCFPLFCIPNFAPNHTTIDCNRHCTVNGVARSLVCNCPVVKRYYFQYKVFVGFVWLTSNHMFGSGNYHPRDFWKFWNCPLYSGNFKILKNALGQFIPNCPPKHEITSTNIKWIYVN